jgi:hypothetical protein
LGDELSSSLLKALGADVVARIADVAGAKKGDAVLIVSGKPKVVAAVWARCETKSRNART